jgi:transcriptional regulator with XRE-family HTH domain
MNKIDIFKIREELGLTQQKFADLIGVDRRTVINYEQGSKIPESKTKLLEMLLAEKRKPKNNIIQERIEINNTPTIDNLNREVLDLKDHIRTLKEFLEEKSKLSEMYKNENLSLREKLSKHEGNVGG